MVAALTEAEIAWAIRHAENDRDQWQRIGDNAASHDAIKRRDEAADVIARFDVLIAKFKEML